MSFFTEEQAQTSKEFEMVDQMEPVPHGQNLKGLIDAAKWSEYEGDRYIDLRYSILEPKPYLNRKIFHKIKVLDTDSKKSDKAKRMLAAIDANTGGGLVKLGREPTDADLQMNLLNSAIMIKVGIWAFDDEVTGEKKKGNWVMAVMEPDNSKLALIAEPPKVDAGTTGTEDEIPF